MVLPRKEFRAQVHGSALRHVSCESCETEFVYFLHREGYAEAVSVLFLDEEGAAKKARMAANADLQRRLSKDVDPVPCPTCGWYQTAMLPELRAAHRRGLSVAGIILLYIAAIFVGVHFAMYFGSRGRDVDPVLLQIAVAIGGAGVTCIALRRLLAWHLDPNGSDADERKALGQRLAMTRTEFDRWLAESDPPPGGS